MRHFIAVFMLAVMLVGCGDGITNREESCYEKTGRDDCFSELRNTDIAKVRAENRVPYATAASPGNYTNYYGSPQHGSWRDGSYHFSDPHSPAAMSTNSFLIGAGVGGLTAYMLTKDSNRSTWMDSHPSGYRTETRVVKEYITPKGSITKEEYKRRMAQSKADRKKNEAKKAAALVAKRKDTKKKAAKKKAAKKKVKPTLNFSKPTVKKTPKPKKRKKKKY